MSGQAQFSRYLRQMSLPEVGDAGQRSFAAAKVLCVGAGGLGSPALLYLAGAGVGTIGIIDFDQVELSNLGRQVIYDSDEVGKLKAEAARDRLEKLNPDISIRIHPEMLTSENALSILSHYQLVIDGTDQFQTKLLINDACLKLGLPWIYASVAQWEGEIALFDPREKKSACFSCYRPALPKAPVQTCAENGVLGPVVGMLGSFQALHALRVFLPEIKEAPAVLRRFDGLSLTWQNLQIPKNSECRVCSQAAHEIQLEETKRVCGRSPSTRVPVSHIGTNASHFLRQYQLLDVRTTEEWEMGHLPAAIHWSLARLEQGEFPKLSPKKPLLIYCQSGIRSERASEILSMLYPNVMQLKDGLSAWPFPLDREADEV